MEEYRKNLAELKGNRPEILTEGKIPDSHICFLDEVFKANDGVLNSLLKALNERVYTNEGITTEIPVISFFSASNEIPNFNNPEEKSLKALYDRFDFKVCTKYVEDKANRMRILKNKQSGNSKYAYVLENKNNTNSTTYEYLKDLKYDNYKDSKDIYNSLYAWKVSIVVNSSANDYTTNRTSISRSSPIYFHIKLSGGPPNGSTRVRYSYELPNGRTGSGSHDGYWNAGSSGSNYWDDGLYQNPAYGETGNLKMEYKDSDGNIIGSVTVRITR